MATMKIHVADAGRKVVALKHKQHNTIYFPIDGESSKCVYIDHEGIGGIAYNSFMTLASDANFERIFEHQQVTLTF